MKFFMIIILISISAELSAGYLEKVLTMHQKIVLNPKLFEQSCKKSELSAINRAIEKYCISPDLCKAVILVESKCRSNAVSKTGDYGLMQINKVHGIYTRIDENIKTGAEILESYFWIMMKEFDFELPEALEKAIEAYNKGVTAIKKQIFKERSEKEQKDIFYCERNFHCYLKLN